MTLKRLPGRRVAARSQGRNAPARLWPVLLVWLLPCLGALGAVGCVVEESPEGDQAGVQTAPAAPNNGTFERLGEQMDRGAEKLDKRLEVGTERLGRAMQKAGRNLEETAAEARERRKREEAAGPTAPKTDIDVDVDVQR